MLTAQSSCLGTCPAGTGYPLARRRRAMCPSPGFLSLPAQPRHRHQPRAQAGRGGCLRGVQEVLRSAGRPMVAPLLRSQFPLFPFPALAQLWWDIPGIMSRNSGEGPCPCQDWEDLDESWPGCAGTGSACRGGTGRSLGTWAGRHRSCASPAKDNPFSVAEGSRR